MSWNQWKILFSFLTSRRARIVYAIFFSVFISQLFGDAPIMEANMLHFQNNISKVSQVGTIFKAKKDETYTTSPAPAQANIPTKPVNEKQESVKTPTPTIYQQTFLPGLEEKTVPSSIPTAIATTIPTNIPVSTSAPEQLQTYSCPSSSGENYESIAPISARTIKASGHGDLNLSLRGYIKVNEETKLVQIGGPTDSLAPQLSQILANRRFPGFVNAYAVYKWNFSSNSRSGSTENKYPVSLVGLKTTPGEVVTVPSSGYDIGEGKEVMVLYADSSRVTMTYTRNDHIVDGYTIHIEDFCVDPSLVSRYNQLNGDGRNYVPGLPAGKKLGTAKNDELKVVIRDTGQWMDPRSRKDWWVGF